jgi:hypothetical protein
MNLNIAQFKQSMIPILRESEPYINLKKLSRIR